MGREHIELDWQSLWSKYGLTTQNPNIDQQLKQILFKKAIVIVQILYVVDHEKAQFSCKMLFREKIIFFAERDVG